MPGIDSVYHNVQRWERGYGDLSERYKLHYCHALGIPPGQFGASPQTVHIPADPGQSPSHPSAVPASSLPSWPDLWIRER
jgi:hypothetical protein